MMRRIICMTSCALALFGSSVSIQAEPAASRVFLEKAETSGVREDLEDLVGWANALEEQDYGTCSDWAAFVAARNEATLLLEDATAEEDELQASYDKLSALYESLAAIPDITGKVVIQVSRDGEKAVTSAVVEDGEKVSYVYTWSNGETKASVVVKTDQLEGLSLQVQAIDRVGRLKAALKMPLINEVTLSYRGSIPVVSWTFEQGENLIPADIMEVRLSKGGELVQEATGDAAAGRLVLGKVTCGNYDVQCVAHYGSLDTNIATTKAYLAHVWSSFTVEQEPDCTHPGIEAMHCTRCGERGDTREIPALGHAFDEGIVAKEPSCEQEGILEHTCTRCGEKTTEAIAALGHDYGDGLIAKEPTCTEAGIIVYTCSRCEKMSVESLPALGHDWPQEYTVVQEPDCTHGGVEALLCTRCHEHGEERALEPLGHAWDNGVIVKYATMDEEGLIRYTCTRCKSTREEAIPRVTESYTGWRTLDGQDYWYENDVRMGTLDDPDGVMGDGLVRGREIYDPMSDAWYWLDASKDGAKAVDKEVWMPYIYNGVPDEQGKWVRYDKDGHMVKGWYESPKGVCYYDPMTGAMAKGSREIDGVSCRFDRITGIGLDMAFYEECWYEKGKRQGTYQDPDGVMGDGFIRGREIYDPATKAWYWLDARYEGKVAKDKEVWMPYIYQNEEPGSSNGKWVRYDKDGHMITGWYVNDNGRYYYDPHTGAMAKGRWRASNGQVFEFDEITGILKP